MSSTLVPSGGSSNFAQQGSVDWVALSGSSVQFSVAVLARLSKAGIDAFTLRFGQAICCNFALEPRAQELVFEAIRKVKKYPSYGDLMWFGFGIKDVVTDLADTEEGLTLVALCAALSTTYDSIFTARVIRELCVLCKAPQSFTPALRQWKTLVELCAGILASSHFVTLANGFRRLICGHLGLSFDTRHSPTTPIALAEAILTLGRISKRSLVSVTISGALDCAWLAAFAESILSLHVGVCDTKGDLLYRSQQCSEAQPQLIILLCPANTARGGELMLRCKASVLPQGQTLLQKDPALHGTSLLNWQSSWSTILHDVFGESVDRLLKVQLSETDDDPATAFAQYLRCISLLQRQDDSEEFHDPIASDLNTSFVNHPVNPLIWTHPNSSGTRFLSFTTKCLPELPARLFERSSLPREDEELINILEFGKIALYMIERGCQCVQHQTVSAERDASEYDTICLLVMAETIVIFLWILIDSDIDADVLPSITGLANLYTWQLPANKSARSRRDVFYASIMNCDYPVLGIDLVFHVLSGVSVSGSPPSHSSLPATDQLARAGKGICVYHHAIEDPGLSLDTIFRLRVVRGYISYSGFRYKDLCGLSGAYVSDSLKLSEMHGDAPVLSVRTVIQETYDEMKLEMAYLFDYRDQDCRRKSRWLHLPFLFRKLQSRIRNNICQQGCDGVYDPGVPIRKVAPPSFFRKLEFEENSVDKAKQLLKSLRFSVNAWLLYNESGVINIIMDQPILLYTLMDQSSLCLAPLTDCFKCIIYIAFYEGLGVTRSGGEGSDKVVIRTSGKSMVELLVVGTDYFDLDGDTSSEPADPMEE